MRSRLYSIVLALLCLLCLAIFTSAQFVPSARSWLRSHYYAKVLGTPLLMEVPRRPIKCSQIQQRQRMVALTFGQSNAANFGDKRSPEAPGVYSFHEGACYLASDPMLGADGFGGSVWPRMGSALVRAGTYREVVFVTLAVGGSSVADWAPGGRLHHRLDDAIVAVRAAGLEVTHMFWHQGERDAAIGTSGADYATTFLALLGSLRAMGIQAPIYVSTATFCHGRDSQAIRSAQIGLVSPAKRIIAGPDTDALNSHIDRHDGCHFSAHGLDRFAAAWVEVLNSAERAR